MHVDERGHRRRKERFQAGVAGRRYTPRQYSESEHRPVPATALRRRVLPARDARHPAQRVGEIQSAAERFRHPIESVRL